MHLQCIAGFKDAAAGLYSGGLGLPADICASIWAAANAAHARGALAFEFSHLRKEH